MKNNDLLNKITHNKLLLFIVPHLIYWGMLLAIYNNNFKLESMNEILFREVFYLGFIFALITILIYFVIHYFIKNLQKVFCILCIICCFYFDGMGLSFLFLALLIFFFKKITKCNMDNIIVVIMFIIIIFFGYNFVFGIINVGYNIIHLKDYSVNKEISINSDSFTPNVYWIHCDGMMSIDTMSKYFNYEDDYLLKYFEENDYIINSNASIKAGHRTNLALVALFNPHYYDEFFKDYLNSLEEHFVNQQKYPTSIVGYNSLKQKRLNSELFKALKNKKYTTYAIAKYNQYTSLNTDYYFDYSFSDDERMHLKSGKTEFRLLEYNNDLTLQFMSDFKHFQSISYHTVLYDVIKDINLLNYDVIDYENFDTSQYKYINNSEYWIAKAILKSLDLSMNETNNKFVFVDYDLNHLPLTFDKKGNILDSSLISNLDYYLDNYIYSTYLLVDILSFIHNNDKDAIIIVQADHGIHLLSNEEIMKYFDIDINKVMDIRNSTISAIYIPEKYKNGDEKYLNNPLNISRYIVNNYVGENYEYLND